LTEVIARTIKNLMRFKLREQLSDIKVAMKGPNPIIVEFLRPVFGNAIGNLRGN
jgi:hypothetical protein